MIVKMDKRFIVCPRCGELGHRKEECTKSVEELFNIEKEVEENARDAVFKIESENNYDHDEFGPCEMADIDGDSWENEIYCVNCGGKGHNWTSCEEPRFSKTLEMIKKEEKKRLEDLIAMQSIPSKI